MNFKRLQSFHTLQHFLQVVDFMIKLLVCFKVVRDFEGITPSELCELRDGNLKLNLFKKVIGSYDEAALETGRQLASQILAYEPCSLHAVTVGPCEARFAKDLYAVGFDEVFHVSPSQEPQNPDEIASAIYDLVQSQNGYHAILTGKQAWPEESGLMPHLLAHRLHFPCISQVTDLTWENDIRVTARTDYSELHCTVKSPAVYIIGDAAHPYLKAATLMEKLAVRERQASLFTPSSCSSKRDFGKTEKLLYEKLERSCHFMEGKTSREKAENFWREVQEQWENL